MPTANWTLCDPNSISNLRAIGIPAAPRPIFLKRAFALPRNLWWDFAMGVAATAQMHELPCPMGRLMFVKPMTEAFMAGHLISSGITRSSALLTQDCACSCALCKAGSSPGSGVGLSHLRYPLASETASHATALKSRLFQSGWPRCESPCSGSLKPFSCICAVRPSSCSKLGQGDTVSVPAVPGPPWPCSLPQSLSSVVREAAAGTGETG